MLKIEFIFDNKFVYHTIWVFTGQADRGYMTVQTLDIVHYESCRNIFNRRLEEFQSLKDHKLSIINATVKLFKGSQETLSRSLNRLRYDIRPDKPLEELRMLIAASERKMVSQLAEDFNYSKLKLPYRLGISDFFERKLFVRLSVEEVKELEKNSATSPSNGVADYKWNKVAEILSHEMLEALRLNEQFSSKYNDDLTGPMNLVCRPVVKKIAICLMEIFSSCTRLQHDLLSELDHQLTLLRPDYAPNDTKSNPKLDQHDFRFYRNEMSQMSSTIALVFSNTMELVEAAINPLEAELENVRLMHMSYCDDLFQPMRYFEFTKGDLEFLESNADRMLSLNLLIKCSVNMRLKCFEALRRICAYIQNETIKHFDITRQLSDMLRMQQDYCIRALFLNIQAHSQIRNGPSTRLPYEKIIESWLHRPHEQRFAYFEHFRHDANMALEKYVWERRVDKERELVKVLLDYV